MKRPLQVHIEPDWSTGFLNVWLIDYGRSGIEMCSRILEADGKTLKYEVKPGDPLGEPSFRILEDMFAELIREGSKTLPASDATVAHLKDTIAVRDRMITMIEKMAG